MGQILVCFLKICGNWSSSFHSSAVSRHRICKPLFGAQRTQTIIKLPLLLWVSHSIETAAADTGLWGTNIRFCKFTTFLFKTETCTPSLMLFKTRINSTFKFPLHFDNDTTSNPNKPYFIRQSTLDKKMSYWLNPIIISLDNDNPNNRHWLKRDERGDPIPTLTQR